MVTMSLLPDGMTLYVNVYEDRRGRWHYGIPTYSYERSLSLPNGFLGYVGQRMWGRRHVCRLRIRRRPCQPRRF